MKWCCIVFLCRHFAKKTLIKTAQKAGIKTKPRKTKYGLTSQPGGPRSYTPRSSDSESEGGRPGSEIFDDLSSMLSLMQQFLV